MNEGCLIVSPVGVGNALLLTPLVDAIASRRAFRELHCVAWSDASAEVFRRLPGVTAVHCLRSRPLSSLRSLLSKRGEIEWGLAGFPCTRAVYRLPFLLCAPSHTAAHLGPGDPSFGISKILSLEPPMHDVERNLEILTLMGLERPPSPKLLFRSAPQEEEEAGILLKELGLKEGAILGLHPGSSARNNMWMKRWPASEFAKLARIARKEFSLEPLVFLGPEELDLRESMLRIEPGLRILSVSRLGTAAALLRRCRALVANDSALMHLACSQGTAVLALFGPSPESRTAPWAVPRRIVVHDLDCRPCWPQGRPGRHPACWRKDLACLRELSLARAADGLRDLLEGLP